MVSKTYASEFDVRCKNSNAYVFLHFITQKSSKNVSYLDLISTLNKNITTFPTKEDKYMQLSETEIKNYMNEFFSAYFPKKAEEVKKILNKTHTYFLDSDGTNHVNFVYADPNNHRTSNVTQSGNNLFLEFNVYIHNTLEDLRVTAHELSHALSSQHKHMIDLLRSKDKNEDIEGYKTTLKHSLIMEIESNITERLFNRFLVEKDVYSQKDIDNYQKKQQASLRSEINLIQEESEILKNLSQPVTSESLNNLIDNLNKNGDKNLLKRIEKMYDGQRSSEYMFKYVVGRIVADQWMKEFEKNPDKRASMLNKFQDYLDKTFELSLDSACEILIDKNFDCALKDYIDLKQNENKNLKEKI